MTNDRLNGRNGDWWRWVMGGVFALQFAIMALMWNELGAMRSRVDQGNGQSTRAILDERSSTWIPVIQDNRIKVNALHEQIAVLNGRLDRLEQANGK